VEVDATRAHDITVGWGSRRRLLVMAAAFVGVLIVVSQLRSRPSSPGSRPAAQAPAPKSPAGGLGDRATTTTTGHVDAVGPAPATTTTVAPPILNHQTGTLLVLAGPTRISTLDLDHNSTRTIDLPPGAGGNLANNAQGPGSFAGNHALIARGRFVVFQGGDETLAVPIDLSRQPVSLGKSVAVIGSIHPDRVWLLGLTSGMATVREVDLQGRVTTPPVALPVDWSPQAALDNGLLLTNSATFEVWDPHSGRTTGVSPPSALTLTADSRRVVWISGFGCQVLCATHIRDVMSGTEHVVYSQAGTPFSAAFSPDGRKLALSLNIDGPSTPGGLLMVDSSTYATTLVPIAAASSSQALWSPSGKWLFFLNANGGNSSTIFASQLGTVSADALNLPSSVDGSALAAF
jgi:hypothetical protein